jgi:hypothetical protein
MKQKSQIAMLVVLVVLASIVWYAQSSKTVGPEGGRFIAQNYEPLGVDNPALHWDELNRTRKTEYKSNGRNPFSVQAAPVAPVPGAPGNPLRVKDSHKPQGPPLPPPVPPPVWPGNVAFFGYGTIPNGTARRAFLTVDGEVQVVAEGDTLLGRYRILQINTASLEFEDISTGLRSTKALDADKGGTPPA